MYTTVKSCDRTTGLPLFQFCHTSAPKTGELVGVKIADDSQDVMLITDTGTIIRMNVSQISILGRTTQGVTLIRTNDGEKVVSVEIVEREEHEI